MRVKDLEGSQLDWAVAKAEGGLYQGASVRDAFWMWPGAPVRYSVRAPDYSAAWALGGPLIELGNISVSRNLSNDEVSKGVFHLNPTDWLAQIDYSVLLMAYSYSATGPTPLIAAMRCYALSKLGEEIEIPEDLA
jgi:hypothetical protein